MHDPSFPISSRRRRPTSAMRPVHTSRFARGTVIPMRRTIAIAAATFLVFAGTALDSVHAQQDQAQPLLGPTLSTLFNPRTAPAQKTMGLLQRSFLDLVEESQPKLEVAFVIDGTDSMAAQL